MKDYKLEIAQKIGNITQISVDKIYASIEKPPQQEMGDYAFPCFILAKELRKSPVSIAQELAESLEGQIDFIKKIDTVGGYLNIFINPDIFIYEVVENTISERQKFASSNEGVDKTVLVEYSSPNIAKPFHIGHAFTTILGNTLNNIYKNLGYDTQRLNHLGDYGTQFGKLISAYKRWGDEKKLVQEPIKELLRIYVKFHEMAKDDPALEIEAREYFKKLENKSPEELGLWNRFKELSLKEFDVIYKRLGVEFDDLNGESFYSDKISEVVDILEKKNLLVDSEGAKVVMLEDFNLPPCIILKSDGTTIYASRDIAAVLYRSRKYNFYKNIYVVGNTQALHFNQVFAVAKKMEIEGSENCEHVEFGLVKFADMKFSTREGNIILLEDLLNEVVSKTYEIIKENNIERNSVMDDNEMEEAAEKIGVGAVIYTFCKNSRQKDIVFSWDEMLSFEGDSAPYVMYTYARCKSILRKAEVDENTEFANISDGFKLSDNPEEYNLAKLIYGVKESIQASAKSNEPYILVRQINSIARAFNKFYNNSPIINNSDEKVKNARLALCVATSIALSKGMKILGINPVERM